MSMSTYMVVRFAGEMSAARLESIRNGLDLTTEGRLDDDEDSTFGYRYLRRDKGNFVLLELSRLDDTQWHVRLTYQNEPPSDAVVEELRSQTVAAAKQAGFEVDHSYTRPGGRRDGG